MALVILLDSNVFMYAAGVEHANKASSLALLELLELLDLHPRLSARDALHAASCLLVGNGRICSFDHDFDDVQQFTRLEPAALL